MAHLIEQMAYVGATPWHGLGNNLPRKQPIEIWQREAGMDWQILESPVHFKSDAVGHLGAIHSYPEQKVLYRSDTKAPLSVVSNRYHTVQPREVLEFYRDLTEVSGYELETAGVLKGGRKFWALARTGQGTAIRGLDQVNGYLLLATSCDGTLATTATPTTVRVVCNNTLTIALDGTSRAIKVPHNTRFDPQAVKKQLGIAVSQWDDFMYRMRHLAERKVQWHEAMGFALRTAGELNTWKKNSFDHGTPAFPTTSPRRWLCKYFPKLGTRIELPKSPAACSVIATRRSPCLRMKPGGISPQ
jgi:phage/plasmid-like protein (TIGR03299 family)